MKKAISLSILLFSLVTCHKNSLKKDFIGNWSTSSNDPNYDLNIDIQFFEDSAVVNNSLLPEYSFEWKARRSKINGNILRNIGYFDDPNFTTDYKFSSNKDTLYMKHENDTMPYIRYLKINNRYEYFQNKVGLTIDLPTSDKELELIGEERFNIELFIGYKDGKLVSKMADKIISIKENVLMAGLFSAMAKYSKSELDNLKIVLIADKSVPRSQLDTIKMHFRKSSLKRIFRVYKTDSVNYQNIDWHENINWYGLQE